MALRLAQALTEMSKVWPARKADNLAAVESTVLKLWDP
jgi:hypothetical protein